MAVDQVCYRFSVSRSAPDIFAVKVWSCPKSRQILNLIFEQILNSIHTCNFFVCRPKFANFLLNPTEIYVDQVCSRFLISRYVTKIFAIKFESCPNLGRIFDFLALPNFWGASSPPKKLYISDHAHLKFRLVAKYRRATPTTPKVIGAHLLKFKPISEPPLKKLSEGPLSPVGVR